MGEDNVTALDLPMVEPLPEATQKYFDICREKIGFVPNVLKAYAHDIDKLNGFTGMYNHLMLADSGLSKLEREMIAVVVSSLNRCYYCLVAHGAAVRQLSGNPELGEMLVMNYKVAPLSPRERTMLDFRGEDDHEQPPYRGIRPTGASRCRFLGCRHLGHRGSCRVLQHVEPHFFGDRQAAESGISRRPPLTNKSATKGRFRHPDAVHASGGPRGRTGRIPLDRNDWESLEGIDSG